MTVAALGLGGNIGDTREVLRAAVAGLAVHASIRVEAASPLYRTPPWGKTDQAAFLNAALRIDTELSPAALLAAILEIERRLGRERAERWGPRTLDIDILLYGSASVEAPGLRIPHPRLAERAFALQPLVDVLPQAAFAGRRAEAWLAAADRAGMVRIDGPDWCV